MKKAIIAIAFWAASVGAFAQGQVDFTSFQGYVNGNTPSEAAVYNVDGTTRLQGSAFLAQLYWSATAFTGTVGGAAVAAPAAPFLTAADASAGFWDAGASGARTVGVAAGTAVFVQVRAWAAADGATWEAAKAANKPTGASNVLQLSAGGGTVTPPGLTGLQKFQLVAVPEPTTIALGILGAGALLLRRRK